MGGAGSFLSAAPALKMGDLVIRDQPVHYILDGPVQDRDPFIGLILGHDEKTEASAVLQWIVHPVRTT